MNDFTDFTVNNIDIIIINDDDEFDDDFAQTPSDIGATSDDTFDGSAPSEIVAIIPEVETINKQKNSDAAISIYTNTRN